MYYFILGGRGLVSSDFQNVSGIYGIPTVCLTLFLTL